MAAIEETNSLDELTRENEVANRLVERLGELALRLRDGAPVAPGEIAEGLRLLTQHRAVHARRFDEDLQPEARAVAMPECFEHLNVVDQNFRRLSQDVEDVRRAIDAYAHGAPEGRIRLAAGLDAFTQGQYEGLQYEGQFPLSCLRATLADPAAEQVRQKFEKDATELADIEGHIDHYLARAPGTPGAPISIRCHQPGCAAQAEGETYPAEGGALGFRPPTGWRGVSQTPRTKGGHRISVAVDFYCPQPAARAPSAPPPATVGPDAERTVEPAAPSEGGAEDCPCCNPLPADLS